MYTITFPFPVQQVAENRVNVPSAPAQVLSDELGEWSHRVGISDDAFFKAANAAMCTLIRECAKAEWTGDTR